MRKYIDELGITDIPQNWLPTDSRQEAWAKQRKKYGFDERETWNLDYTLKLLLYERLCAYDDFAPVNKEYHKINYNNEKEITLRECLDRMIEGLKIDLTMDRYDPKRKEEEIENKINDVFYILYLCKDILWW